MTVSVMERRRTIILTEEEEKFDKQFQPVESKIDKVRKKNQRHVSGRGVSSKKKGARNHDVKPETMNQYLLDFPDQFLQVQGGQLHCGTAKYHVRVIR